MVRYVLIAVTALFLALLIGCSGFDSTQVLIHPEAAAPSATIDVALVNLYTYIDTAGSIVSKNVTRDSLHLLVGMPETWEVTEAKVAVVNDMTTEQLFAMQNSLADPQALALQLGQYQASAATLGADGALAGKLAGDTVDAHGPDGDIPVVIDEVKKVKGFGGPVSIEIVKGSRTDTVFAFDSMLLVVEGTGVVPDSTMTAATSLLALPGLKKPDSLGVIMIPVVVFLKIKVGGQEGADTLYYYTKTGSMNQAPSPIITTIALLKPDMKPMLTSLESGDMAFVPFTVSSAAAVSARQTGRSFSDVTVAAGRTSGTVRIDLGSSAAALPVVSVYSLRGNLIADIGVQAASRSVVWNGTDLRGNRVGTGTYLVRVAGVNGSVVRRVQLVR